MGNWLVYLLGDCTYLGRIFEHIIFFNNCQGKITHKVGEYVVYYIRSSFKGIIG